MIARIATLLTLTLATMAAGAPKASGAGGDSATLVVAGSGSNIASIRLLAEAFGKHRPGVRIDVPASIGSAGGIRAAAEGAIAAGVISRQLKAREQGLGLTVVPYARTVIVVGAHPSVADEGIAADDLVRIQAGRRSRWRDGREIVVLTREPGDSTIEVLQREIPGFAEVYAESQRARRWITLFTDQEMAHTLARTPYAIGFSDTGALAAGRQPIKVLKVDGVLPTPENVASGKYRLVKTLSFVFADDRLPAGARAFIDFARSSEGAGVLKLRGYLPGR